jgi:hypothetical protein
MEGVFATHENASWWVKLEYFWRSQNGTDVVILIRLVSGVFKIGF